MEPIAHLVKVSVPNYLAGLPIPDSIGGWFRLRVRDWFALVPPTALLAGLGYMSYRAFCPRGRPADRGGRGKHDGDREEEEAEELWKEEEMWNKIARRAEEGRRKGEKRERRKVKRENEEEQKRREKTKKNIIWRGIVGDGPKARRRMAERIMERELGRRVKVKGVAERIGDGGNVVLVMELEVEEDKEEILERGWEIKNRWEVEIDEDLTERKEVEVEDS